MKRNELLQQTAQEARRYRLIRIMSEMDSLMLQLGATGTSAAARIQSLNLPEGLRADLHDLRDLRNRLAHEDDDHEVQDYELSRAEGEAQQALSSLCMMLWMNGTPPRIRRAHQPGRQALLSQAREMGLNLGLSRHEQQVQALQAEVQRWSQPGPARMEAQQAARAAWRREQWHLIRKAPLGAHSPLRGPLMNMLPLSLMSTHLILASSWLQGMQDNQVSMTMSLIGTGNGTLHLMVAIGLLSGTISQGLRGRVPALLALWLGHLLLTPTPGILLLELTTAASLMLRAEVEAAPRTRLPTVKERAEAAQQALERELRHGEQLRAMAREVPGGHQAETDTGATDAAPKTRSGETQVSPVCTTPPSLP